MCTHTHTNAYKISNFDRHDLEKECIVKHQTKSEYENIFRGRRKKTITREMTVSTRHTRLELQDSIIMPILTCGAAAEFS